MIIFRQPSRLVAEQLYGPYSERLEKKLVRDNRIDTHRCLQALGLVAVQHFGESVAEVPPNRWLRLSNEMLPQLIDDILIDHPVAGKTTPHEIVAKLREMERNARTHALDKTDTGIAQDLEAAAMSVHGRVTGAVNQRIRILDWIAKTQPELWIVVESPEDRYLPHAAPLVGMRALIDETGHGIEPVIKGTDESRGLLPLGTIIDGVYQKAAHTH